MQTLTIDVGGTKALFELTLSDRIEQYKIPTGEHFSIEDLNQQIEALEQDYGLTQYHLAIGVPGLVREDRLVICKSLPGLTGLSFEKVRCKGELKCISNDIDAGMHAICHEQNDCELLVMSGTGIGMAIAIKGKLFTGASGFAGELGHCRVMTESGEFSLEQLASGESVRARKLQSNDDLYRAGNYLGMGLAWAVNLFNPNRIWLAGGMMNNAEYYKGCVTGLKDMALTAPIAQCKVQRVDDMETLVCRGLKVILAQS